MFDPKIEALAQQVRQSTGTDRLPLDLVTIAEYEGVLLTPVTQHDGFNGKIEFLPEENTFVIYHPDPNTYPYPTRLRFSISHELGHFYIDEHRQALVRGEGHSSQSGFRSKDPRERQADEFAAALLIPGWTMESKIEKRGFMTLEEIRSVATDCEASLYATTIRYVRMTSEPCVVVLAKGGKIKSSFFSDEARVKRFGKIAGTDLPRLSPGHALSSQILSDEIREQRHDTQAWFGRGDTPVWENCISLGDGFTLSLVAIEQDEN